MKKRHLLELLFCIMICLSFSSCEKASQEQDLSADATEPVASALLETGKEGNYEEKDESGEGTEVSGEGGEDESLEKMRQLISTVSYDENHFVSEKEFYSKLEKALELKKIKMTCCEDGTAHFYFDYENISSVKIFSIGVNPEQVAEDIAKAKQSHKDSRDAFSDGDLYRAQNFGLNPQYVPDYNKDVRESDDLVVSFVICGSDSKDDQALFYMVSSIALAILDPNIADDEMAFDSLKNNLLMVYANNQGDTDYASWIDGITPEESLTIPGNAVECWFGTKEDKSLWLDITLYIYYEEMIDVGTAIG